MAQSLNQARAKIKTSVHGRRLGLDNDENLVGVKDIRKVVTNATSATTGTALPNHGLVSVLTTTDDSWTLTDPVAGGEVTLTVGGDSTGIHTIKTAAATIYSTNGHEGANVILTSQGAHVKLMGLTTAIWTLTSKTGSTSAAVTS